MSDEKKKTKKKKKTIYDQIKEKIENTPSDKIKKRAEDWWKSQTKIKPMELKHGGKTKHFRGNKQHD